MNKRIFCLFLGIIYIFFTSFGTLPAKASGTDVVGSISSSNDPNEVDTISVQKKNILAYNYQSITVTIKNNNGIGYTGGSYTGVKNITVDYKLPSGSYTQVSLSRNSLTDSTFVGSIYAADAGTWTVSDITEYFFNGGFKIYSDRDEGGSYELNDGNFTVYSSDTTGPVLDSLFVNNTSVLSGGNVTVTINAHDDLSDIQSAYLSYQTPNGNYIQLSATSIGNNQYQVNIPASLTAGNYSYGKFQCVDVGLTDSHNNSTYFYDYSYYSTRDLSSGDFTVKAEGYAPVLTNISIDKSSMDSGDSIKVTAQIDDASGVSVANLNYMKPDGTTSFAVFNHLYGDVYEADIPGSETLNNIGQWRIFDVYLEDIYENGIYIFNSMVYQFGDRDLSNLNFYVNYKDVTPPTIPTVNDVTDQSTSITGSAEAGSSIFVKSGDNLLGSGVADAYGNFSVPIPAQTAGTILTVTATDHAGNTSGANQVTVRDATPPNAPTVNEVTDQAGFLDGTAEPGSTITVTSGDGFYSTNVTFTNGYYYIPFSVMPKAGTKFTVTATDAAGNASAGTDVVVKDVTAPSVPVVNQVTEKSASVTGSAEAGAKISFKIGDIEYTGTADENGNFSVEIPQQKVNTVFYVTAEDAAGNVSEPTGVVVVDVTPPDIPQVNEVNDQLKEVSGTAEPGATAAVVVFSSSYETKVDENGHFSITIPELKAGMTLQVYAYDSFGNGSPYKTVTVMDKTAPQAPTANEVKDQDTSVTGSAEAGATVEVKVNGSVIGTGTAGADGSFTVAIPVQKAGTNLTVAATDEAGNVSEEIGVTVKDVTAPTVPTVNEVTDKSTVVTGTAEPGSTITVRAGSSVVGTAVAKDDGTFSVSIVLQKAGTKLTVVATDHAGNVSQSREVTVKDVTAPNVLTVNAITNKSTLVTGKTESYAIVTVKIGSKIYTATADGSGNYKATIPVQNAGTSISITATDRTGNASAAKTVTVAKVAPNMPTVNAVNNKSALVSGKTEKYVKVTVKIGTQTFIANADGYGNYKVTIPVQNAGTSISITATDSKGNASAATTATIAKVAPNMPTVNAVNNKSALVSGRTEKYAKITVKIGTQTFTATADVYGNYKVTIPVQNAGTSISITATDSKGNASAATTVTVAKVAPNMPTVNAVNNKSASVTGKTEKYAKVTVKIGTQIFTETADGYGNYKVTIPVQNAGTSISITATDSKGNASAATTATVAKVAPNMPTVSTVNTKSTSVTGKTEKYAIVTVKIGTKTYTTKADGYSNFKVNIPVQHAGTKIYVNAKDSKGMVSATRIVTVTS